MASDSAATDGGLKQELDPGQRIPDFVSDAGGELTDGGELLGPEQVPLLFLKPWHNSTHPADHPIELLVQFPEVGRRPARSLPRLLGPGAPGLPGPGSTAAPPGG